MNIPGIKGKNEKHYLLCFAEGKLCFQNLGMQYILNGVLTTCRANSIVSTSAQISWPCQFSVGNSETFIVVKWEINKIQVS